MAWLQLSSGAGGGRAHIILLRAGNAALSANRQCSPELCYLPVPQTILKAGKGHLWNKAEAAVESMSLVWNGLQQGSTGSAWPSVWVLMWTCSGLWGSSCFLGRRAGFSGAPGRQTLLLPGDSKGFLGDFPWEPLYLQPKYMWAFAAFYFSSCVICIFLLLVTFTLVLHCFLIFVSV